MNTEKHLSRDGDLCVCSPNGNNVDSDFKDIADLFTNDWSQALDPDEAEPLDSDDYYKELGGGIIVKGDCKTRFIFKNYLNIFFSDGSIFSLCDDPYEGYEEEVLNPSLGSFSNIELDSNMSNRSPEQAFEDDDDSSFLHYEAGVQDEKQINVESFHQKFTIDDDGDLDLHEEKVLNPSSESFSNNELDSTLGEFTEHSFYPFACEYIGFSEKYGVFANTSNRSPKQASEKESIIMNCEAAVQKEKQINVESSEFTPDDDGDSDWPECDYKRKKKEQECFSYDSKKKSQNCIISKKCSKRKRNKIKVESSDEEFTSDDDGDSDWQECDYKRKKKEQECFSHNSKKKSQNCMSAKKYRERIKNEKVEKEEILKQLKLKNEKLLQEKEEKEAELKVLRICFDRMTSNKALMHDASN